MTGPGPWVGVVLAGGGSRRFGSPKALAEVGGVSMARRAADALEPHVRSLAVLTDDPDVALALAPLPVRRDRIAGLGPVGGILTALHWARDEEAAGALVLACDLPLVPPALLALVVGSLPGAGSVVPASPGPLGVEPLCAGYTVDCLETVAAFVDRGGGSARALLAELEPRVIPLGVVARVVDPARAFLNVNTPEDAVAAGRLVRRDGG